MMRAHGNNLTTACRSPVSVDCTSACGSAPRRATASARIERSQAAPRRRPSKSSPTGCTEPELRQDIEPTLARRKQQHVRQRHKHTPGQHEEQRCRTCASPAPRSPNAAAEVEAVENLVRRRDPQQHAADSRTISADDGPTALTNIGRSHGPAAASSRPILPMNAAFSAIIRLPSARPDPVARADRLADERRAGERDADARHVCDRCQHQDDLGRRAFHLAQAHLHQLEERKAEQIRGSHRAHRKAQPELAKEVAYIGVARSGASGRRDEARAAETARARTARRTACSNWSPTPTPAMPKPSSSTNSQLSAALTSATRPVVMTETRRAASTIEEPEQRPRGDPERSAQHARSPNSIACRSTSGSRPTELKVASPAHASPA